MSMLCSLGCGEAGERESRSSHHKPVSAAGPGRAWAWAGPSMATISASGVLTPPRGDAGLRGLMGEQGEGELSWHISRSFLEVEEDEVEQPLRGERGEGVRT